RVAGRWFVGRRRRRREAATRQTECRDSERHGTDQETPTPSTDLALTARHFGDSSPGTKQPAVPDVIVGWGRFRSGSPQAYSDQLGACGSLPPRSWWLCCRSLCWYVSPRWVPSPGYKQ